MKKFILISFVCLCAALRSQCVFSGALSIYNACNGGQGCTGGCDLTAYQAISGYTMCNGSAFNGNCFGASSSGGQQTQGITITIPAGCTMMVTAEFMPRGASCPNSGMDSGDKLILNGTTYTGSSNASVSQSVSQTGGAITIVQSANRSDEILTYTTSVSGVCPSCVILPVQLASFSCIAGKDDYTLLWSTASEHNSRRFDIEYSKDAMHFYKATSVEAAGESENLRRYQASVPDTFRTSLIYFRLKQVNEDESFTYSPVVFTEKQQAEEFYIAPNPTEGGLISISGGNKIYPGTTIEVFDATGKKLLQSDAQSSTSIDLTGFGKGMYLVRVCAGEKCFTKKVLYN